MLMFFNFNSGAVFDLEQAANYLNILTPTTIEKIKFSDYFFMFYS